MSKYFIEAIIFCLSSLLCPTFCPKQIVTSRMFAGLICRRYMSQNLFPAHMGTSTHWSYDTGYHGGKRRHGQRRVWGLTTRSRAQEELELQKEGW